MTQNEQQELVNLKIVLADEVLARRMAEVRAAQLAEQLAMAEQKAAALVKEVEAQKEAAARLQAELAVCQSRPVQPVI